jgi:3-hydroxyacyl-CoA dehydrogenase
MGASKIKQIAVIGPGMMGHAIAQEFAQAGYRVTLCGRSEDRLQEALQKIERNLRELAQWAIVEQRDVTPACERIRTTTAIEAGGSETDLVVESIIEDLEVKHGDWV